MMNRPVIVMQLIHIEGPLKGEIQEFSNPEILSHSVSQRRKNCFPKTCPDYPGGESV